jgi:tetratricopeptide (TPR) repeat protein
MYSTANLSDKELKDQGNRLFSLKKYEDAVSCYTKAIVRIPILSCLTIYKLYVYFLYGRYYIIG